jgi:segregation and condensation protein B
MNVIKIENNYSWLMSDDESLKKGLWASLRYREKDYFMNATHSQNSDMVKNFLNADLREKLTEATVEVLAIIAYRQPIAKSEIEAIRGVNSQYSIRHLLMRGLIEKISNPDDGRSNYYQVTTEFMQQLGLTSMADLPDFETLVSKISLPQTPALSDENKTAPDDNPSAVSEI